MTNASLSPTAESVSAAIFKSFEEAFDGHTGSSVRTCECGVTFYNSDGGWTWEEGELEKLEADATAHGLPWPVGCIEFEGRYYVSDCECWKPRALRIIGFLLAHDREIAEFLTLERRRKEAEATISPIVK